MKLTKEQLNAFKEDGYLFLETVFTPDEVDVMLAEIPAIFNENTPRNIREKKSSIVRTNFAAHNTNDVFRRLSQDIRLVEPARQILGSEVYIHQFKINAKSAFDGDVWEWHQDSLVWSIEDGMPTDRVLTFMVFLEEVTEFNGPLMLIPGSHKYGLLNNGLRDLGQDDPSADEVDWMGNLTANLKHAINNDTITELVKKGGIVAPKGSPGSILLFHGSLLHGSTSNISPFSRTCIFITLNSMENRLGEVKNSRPQFIAERNFTPIKPLCTQTLLSTI